jgi:hypothetical protein
MSVAVLPRLQGALLRLAEQGEAADAANVPLPDGKDEIPPEQRAAWRNIISGFAAGEGMEEMAIGPMLDGLRHVGFDDEAVIRFFTTQGKDELRHRDLFQAYIDRHFPEVDPSRHLTRRFLYDGLFPRLVASAKRRPLRMLMPLLAFERSGGTLYVSRLIELVEGKLPVMAGMLKAIRQDEARHVAGVGMTARALIEAQPPGPLERRFLNGAVALVIADMDRQAWWKPGLRARMAAIGMDAQAMNRDNAVVHAEMKRIIAGREPE